MVRGHIVVSGLIKAFAGPAQLSNNLAVGDEILAVDGVAVTDATVVKKKREKKLFSSVSLPTCLRARAPERERDNEKERDRERERQRQRDRARPWPVYI